MRNGIYVVYMGNEYEAGVRDGNSFILRSPNSSDVANGFSLYKGTVYVKAVRRSEVNKVYRIKTFAEYKGIKFQVMKEDKDSLLISAMDGDYKVFESLGMDMIERGVYQKWINRKDVTSFQEVKSPA